MSVNEIPLREEVMLTLIDLYGEFDSRGFIIVPNKTPDEIQSEINQTLGKAVPRLFMYVTICPYDDGSMIRTP